MIGLSKSNPYEPLIHPEFELNTENIDVSETVKELLRFIDT